MDYLKFHENQYVLGDYITLHVHPVEINWFKMHMKFIGMRSQIKHGWRGMSNGIN